MPSSGLLAMRHPRVPSPEACSRASLPWGPSVPACLRVCLGCASWSVSARGGHSGPTWCAGAGRETRGPAPACHAATARAEAPRSRACRAARAQELAGDEAAAPLLAAPAGLTDLLLDLAYGAAAVGCGGDLALARAAAMVLATLGPPGLPARLGMVRAPDSCGCAAAAVRWRRRPTNAAGRGAAQEPGAVDALARIAGGAAESPGANGNGAARDCGAAAEGADDAGGAAAAAWTLLHRLAAHLARSGGPLQVRSAACDAARHGQ